MLLAQAIGDYASLSAILASMEEAWLIVKNQIGDLDSSRLVVAGLIVFALLFLWNRR